MYYVFFILEKIIIISKLDFEWFIFLLDLNNIFLMYDE